MWGALFYWRPSQSLADKKPGARLSCVSRLPPRPVLYRLRQMRRLDGL
jgi:hypothetical protein